MSKISQNRDAPAYQEYAATMLSKIEFRTMSLQERGLFFTMRLECWVNCRLPQDSSALAKMFGVSIDEIESCIDSVMPFFEVVDGYIISPELENYRAYLNNQKERMSTGGSKGAAVTNGKRKRSKKPVVIDDSATSTPPLSGTSSAPPSGLGRGLSTAKSSSEQLSQKLSPYKRITSDTLIDEETSFTH